MCLIEDDGVRMCSALYVMSASDYDSLQEQQEVVHWLNVACRAGRIACLRLMKGEPIIAGRSVEGGECYVPNERTALNSVWHTRGSWQESASPELN